MRMCDDTSGYLRIHCLVVRHVRLRMLLSLTHCMPTCPPCASIGPSLHSSRPWIQQGGGSLSPVSEPPSKLGCDSDRRLHIWVNIAVIGKRSRCGEGEHEGLILGDIARRIECSVIACHCMGGIT